LRAFYEFIIQAVNANVLLVAGEEKPQIKAVAWSLKLHFAFAMIFGVGAIVLGIEGLLIDEIQIPRRVDEILLGIVAMSVALSLGYALAASVLRGYNCEVYEPQMYWRSIFPHFRVNTVDEVMGGRDCQIAVSLLKVTPVFFVSGMISLYLPNLEYIMLLGMFYITNPFEKNAALDLIYSFFRGIRVSTSQDFFLVENRLLKTVLNKRVNLSVKAHLLFYTFYAVVWFLVLFFTHKQIYRINYTDLLTGILDAGGVDYNSITLFITFSVVIVGTVAMAVWVVVRNVLQVVGDVVRKRKKKHALSSKSMVSQETVREMLRDSPLFSGCHDRVIDRVAEVVERMEVKSDHYIIQEGDEGDAYFIIESGKVAVIKDLHNGQEAAVAELSTGSGFGETALMQNVPRTRSVKAINDTVLLVLSRENFERNVLVALGEEKVKENLQIRAFVEQVPLCRDWHEKALQELSEGASFTNFEKGEYALKKGGKSTYSFTLSTRARSRCVATRGAFSRK